jgi:glycosyltransferase involved in cell wall biosynthesis
VNILLINHYAGSPSMGMEYRPYYMAREWKKIGHNVLIVSASYSHLHSKNIQLKKIYEKHNIEGVDYFIIKTPVYMGNNYKRFINIFAFVWRLYTKAKIIAEEFNPDIVISSSVYVFDIYPAKKIAKISNAKLIYEVHDLWPLAIIEYGGFSKWHPLILVMQKTENFAYKNADIVVSLLPNALEHMVEHGLSREKFVYVPNGVVIEEWKRNDKIPDDISELISRLKNNNKLILGYAGNHGIANALEAVIHAMKILENENVALLLIGHGPEKENLIDLSKKLNLHNIHFINSVPKEIIPSLLERLDILYIGLRNRPVFRFGISPNKLMDYLMAEKPIIQAIKSGNDIVSDTGCGISVEPENPEAIASAVRKLISLPVEELKEMGKKGRNYCVSKHDYKILANNFVKLMQ